MKDKRNYNNEVRTRVNDPTSERLNKFTHGMTESLGRTITVAQSVRWILESFFGVSVLDEKHYPKTATTLVGPEKSLAEALDKIDELSTTVRIRTESRDDFKGQCEEGVRELLEALQIKGVSSLSHATNLVVNELYLKDQKIKELEHHKEQSIQYGSKLLILLDLEESEDNELSFQRTVERITYMQKQVSMFTKMTDAIQKIAYRLDRKDAMASYLNEEQVLDAFLKDVDTRLSDKIFMFNQMKSDLNMLMDKAGILQDERFTSSLVTYMDNLKQMINNRESQRDEFEKYYHDETDSTNRLLEDKRLLKGEFEDWMSVLSVHKNGSWFSRLLKLFGIGRRITDFDRDWARDEVARIDRYVHKTVRHTEEDDESKES